MQARIIPGGQTHWSIHLQTEYQISFGPSRECSRVQALSDLRDNVSPLVGSGKETTKNTAGKELAHDPAKVDWRRRKRDAKLACRIVAIPH